MKTLYQLTTTTRTNTTNKRRFTINKIDDDTFVTSVYRFSKIHKQWLMITSNTYSTYLQAIKQLQIEITYEIIL